MSARAAGAKNITVLRRNATAGKHKTIVGTLVGLLEGKDNPSSSSCVFVTACNALVVANGQLRNACILAGMDDSDETCILYKAVSEIVRVHARLLRLR